MSPEVGESHRMTNEVGQDSTNEGTEPSEEVAPETRNEPSGRAWSLTGWFWQGQRAQELKRELRQRSPRTEALALRAQATLAAARNLKPEEGETKSASAIVASLYLDAVHWSLEALSEAARPFDPSSGDKAALPEVEGIAHNPELKSSSVTSSSRQGFNPELCARFVQKNLEGAVLTYEKLRAQSATALWEVALDARELADLDRLAEATLDDAERPSRELDDIWFARLVRLVVPLVLLTAVALAGAAAIHRAQVLAETQFAWEASSKYPAEKGCESPQQECAESRFFFCTDNEDKPWIRFDLGETRSISRVLVKNRTDCGGCAERAVPLAIEVSEDGKSWKEVARQTDSFEEWKAKFPAEQARWVRLRAQKRTFLHLQQVRIH